MLPFPEEAWPVANRRVSIYEAMLLQGLPSRLQILGNLTQQVTQVSDAVPPPLARALAKAVRESVFNRAEKLQTSLLTWFETNGRHFPWRKTRDPYRILLAEKLLQRKGSSRPT